MLDEIRTFVLVCDEGSIQRATKRLPLTQPAVSRQIQRLEQALGAQLLDRRQKPPALTPIGTEVLARSRNILRAFEDMKAVANREPQGTFRFGLANGLAHSRLAERMVSVIAQFPRVKLRIKSGWSSDLAEQHASGLLDAAVILSNGTGFQDGEQIGQERVVAVGAPRLASASGGQAEVGWVLSPEPCDARRALARRLAQKRRSLTVTAEIEDAGLQMSLVREGVGLGLLPKRLLEEEGPPAGVVEIDAVGSELRLDVLMLRSPYLGAMRTVADALAKEVRLFITGKKP